MAESNKVKVSYRGEEAVEQLAMIKLVQLVQSNRLVLSDEGEPV